MNTNDPTEIYRRANPVPSAAKPSSNEPAARFAAKAQDVTDCDDTSPAVETYCGTTTDIAALNSVLPFEFSEDDAVTGVEIRVDVDRETGLFSRMEIDATAKPGGSDGTIDAVITYSELGQSQDIQAPRVG